MTPTRARPAERQRPMSARHLHRWPFEQRSVGYPGRRCGPGALHSAGRPWEDDAFHRPGDAHGMIRATKRHEIRAGHDSPGTAELLLRMIEAKLAFLISGGTGSDKTTLELRQPIRIGPASGIRLVRWIEARQRSIREICRDLRRYKVVVQQHSQS